MSGTGLHRGRWTILHVLLALSVLPLPPALASHHQEFGELVRPGITERVSVASDGTQGNARSGAYCAVDGPSISDDGRFVAFTSSASNLDPHDLNGGILFDVYLHDRKTRRTSIVSVNDAGTGVPAPEGTEGPCIGTLSGPLGSYEPAISGDGRYIAFVSALQLTTAGVPGGLPMHAIYVHDRIKGTTELVSMSRTKGELGQPTIADGPSFQPAISQNGRYVTFVSAASNLVDEQTCASSVGGVVAAGCSWQIYVHDRKTDTTQLVSKTADGAPSPGGVATGSDARHSLSDNGRFSVFVTSSNLTPDDQNVCVTAIFCDSRDVFVRDIQSGKTELISVGRAGTSTQALSGLLSPGQAQAISADGRFVVFESNSKDLVPSNTPFGGSIYVRDRQEGRTERITASTGEYLGGFRASISDDGRFVMQWATGGNAIAGEASGEWSGGMTAIVRHDRKTGQTDMVQVDTYKGELQGGNQDWEPSISGSGRHFVWTSLETHGFQDENDDYDVFVRDLGAVDAFGIAFIGLSDHLQIGDPSDSVVDVLSIPDADRDSSGIEGAEVLGARLVYRPSSEDLYLRLEVERLPTMSPFIVGDPALLYGFKVYVGETRYEVRMAGGPLPRFGLFRCESSCVEVAKLRGGFGTAGESVIATIPVNLLPSHETIEMCRVGAYSAAGTFDLDSRMYLDQIGSKCPATDN